MTRIPFVDLAWQHQFLATEIKNAIAEVLEEGEFVLGKILEEFENAFAQVCGVKYAIGVASGTDAIALGLQACGIGKGDEVIVPANTFMATIIGVIRAGGQPVFVDCDRTTALIDLTAAAQAITSQTKAIIPVHLYGQMVSPKKLLDFAKTHQIIIFEDCAQAHGATREGYGAGTVGLAAGFSFYPSKNLGAMGDGGILITNQGDIADKMLSLRNYGASSKYYHEFIGTNSRLDVLQAAILKTKLPHLSNWNRQRFESAQLYNQGLSNLKHLGILPIKNSSGRGHVYHLYAIRLGDTFSQQREKIQKYLSTKGIQTGIHYPIPCHLQPACQYLGYQPGNFPQTEALAGEILSLPLYPGITETQIRQVISQLSVILQALSVSRL